MPGSHSSSSIEVWNSPMHSWTWTSSPSTKSTKLFFLVVLIAFNTSISAPGGFAMATLGGVHELKTGRRDCNMDGMQNALAKFAVDEHNKKENTQLEFSRLMKAEEQVVAGNLHHLTIETIDAGKKKIYLAQVWTKPWLNFKELQKFKLHDSQHPQVEEEASGGGRQDEAQNEQLVHEVALNALKTMQQRSNSLHLYELQEISYSKRKDIKGGLEELTLYLKVRRGINEEKFKVTVPKKDGTYNFDEMTAMRYPSS